MEAMYFSRTDQEKRKLLEAWVNSSRKGNRWPSLAPAEETKRRWWSIPGSIKVPCHNSPLSPRRPGLLLAPSISPTLTTYHIACLCSWAQLLSAPGVGEVTHRWGEKKRRVQREIPGILSQNLQNIFHRNTVIRWCSGSMILLCFWDFG